MEKHCERQHRMIPPGVRGQYIDEQEPQNSQIHSTPFIPSVHSTPMANILSYPAGAGDNDTNGNLSSIITLPHTQPQFLHPASRVVNTYQRRRNSPSLNTNPSDARIGQGYMPQPIQSSFTNNCRPTTEETAAMQTNNQLVYLLPSNMIQTTENASHLQHVTQQYLPCTETLQLPVVTTVPENSTLLKDISFYPNMNADMVMRPPEPPLTLNYRALSHTPRAALQPNSYSTFHNNFQYITGGINHRDMNNTFSGRNAEIFSNESITHENLPPAPSPLILSQEEVRQLRELNDLKKKVANYQVKVEETEFRAQYATTSAIELQMAKLRQQEENLRRREEKAERKIDKAKKLALENEIAVESHGDSQLVLEDSELKKEIVDLRKYNENLDKRDENAEQKIPEASLLIVQNENLQSNIPQISAKPSTLDDNDIQQLAPIKTSDGDGEQRLSSSTIEPCQSSEINANRLSSSLSNCSNETLPNPDYASSHGDKVFDSISESNIDTVLSVKETNTNAMSQKPIVMGASNEQDVIHETPQALQQKIGEIRCTLKQNVKVCSMNSIRSKREKSYQNNIEEMNTSPSVISPKRGRPIKSSPRNPSNQSSLKRTISPKVMLTRIKRQENTTDTETSNENSQLNQNKEERRPKPHRKGRKRKLSSDEDQVNDVIDDVISDQTKKSKTKISNTSKAGDIKCGKCPNTSVTYPTLAKFKDHAIREHGGVAKPFGESQEYANEEELYAILKEAFSTKKNIPCYQCMEKKFTSFGGLKMHLLTCGKSKEECEENLSPQKPETPEAKNVTQEFTSSGRLKRRAASNANVKVEQAFKDIDASIEDDISNDDKDINTHRASDDLSDDEYNFSSEIDPEKIRKLYCRLETSNNNRFSCRKCDFQARLRKQIENHVIDKHSNEAIEISQDDEHNYESEDEVDEEELEVKDEDDDNLYSKKTTRKKSVQSGSKSSNGNDGTFKAPPLVYDKEMIKDEIAFRNSNFCDNGLLFPKLQTMNDDWIKLDASEEKKFLPSKETKSISFKIDSVCNKSSNGDSGQNGIQLECFDSHLSKDKSSITFYTGGSIWAGDWCPLNQNSEQKDVIALSVDMDFQTESKLSPEGVKCADVILDEPKPSSLLQFWECDLPNNTVTTNSEITSKPKLQIGLAHDFGKIWCLKWCPSGCEGTDQCSTSPGNLPRLGLLAAACSDGSIRIFSIPNLKYLSNENEECAIYKAKSSSILTLIHSGIRLDLDDINTNSPCLSLSWFRGRGHRVIAGAYADGNVAIWDIETKSTILRSQKNALNSMMIYPYMFYRAHLTGVKISLDFGSESLKGHEALDDDEVGPQNEDEFFPRYLATGSSDRVFSVWDLLDGVTSGSLGTIVPIRQFRRHLISDVRWLHNYPGHVSVAHDDIYAHANTRSAIVDVTSANFAELRKKDEERQLSCGQFSATCQNSAIFSQAFCPIKNILASSTAAGDLIIHVGLNPSGRRGATFKNDKRKPRRCHIYRSELKSIFDFPRLIFIDMPLNKLVVSLPAEELKMQRRDEYMPSEPIIPTKQLSCPLVQINTVSFSPNFKSVAWLFSGNHSGLGRLHLIKGVTKT